MTKILTLEQAKAIAHSIASLAAAGSHLAKVTTPVRNGATAITRRQGDGSITVRLVNSKSLLVATRKFDGLARFVAEHQEQE